MKLVAVGGLVTFHDTRGVERAALVTAVHGSPENKPAINLVYVSGDENQTDDYGRKTVRASSVVHEDNQSAHGNYWTLD